MNLPNPPSDKALLRKEALLRRAAIRDDAAKRMAEIAAETFLADVPRTPESTIALYWPIRGELDTRPLMAALIDSGAKVCLPVVLADDQPLIFRLWDGQSPLEPSGFATLAPGPDAPEAVPDIILMPLAGFDATGQRLGYGKGFYDRTLAALPSAPLLIGFGFSIQQVDQIAAEGHDVPMHMMITEKGLMRFSRQEPTV